MFKQARRAALTRRSTNLKVDEGKFSDATENSEQFKDLDAAPHKRQILRQNTTLKLEGEMDFSTEAQVEYAEPKGVHRRTSLRRHSTLEKPEGSFYNLTEYNAAFNTPETAAMERQTLSRRLDNLHMESDREFDNVEYKRSFVDYHANYPDIIFKSRKKDTRPRGLAKCCQIKELLLDNNNSKINVNVAEYKASFVPFHIQYPIFKRPRTNLSAPHGIGEKESELHAKFKPPLEMVKKNPSLRPTTNLHLEGKTDFTPEYKRSFINFSNQEGKKNRSVDTRFQKGKRLPMDKTASGADLVHKLSEQTQPNDASFRVLDENNNNTNSLLTNKQHRRSRLVSR